MAENAAETVAARWPTHFHLQASMEPGGLQDLTTRILSWGQDMKSPERWRVIDGYDGEYWVSSHGRVCSLKGRDPIILKPGDSAGYHSVNLLKNGSQKSTKIHRLVAEAFLENPDGFPTVNHKDGDKLNNRTENLEWTSYSENNRHALYSGLKSQVIAVVAIPVSGAVGYYFPSMSATKNMGFCQGAVSAVCLGKKRTHHGFRWQRIASNMDLEIEQKNPKRAAKNKAA
ncbi:MAG: NUMOD4 motif-containing HNH endonuclease [Pseudomonas sp.]